MKGDFTRSTFDARKHYSGVRMQQGRVQLDADWNEQLDIIRHAVESHLRDLLGAAGVPAARAGFGIEVGQRPAGAGDALAPDLLIRSGHYYVDGILCENETPTWLTEQPDNPAAALPSEAADSDSYIVYLDVWQRHITCIEDPDLRELALGGPDTTTRTKTVWQVKLLPIGQDDGAGQPESHDGSLADLPDWKRLVDAAAGKGQLKVRRSTQAQQLRNQLYRVEIHDADPQAPTFKWSRENGSIAFPIVGLTILPAPNAGAPAPTQPADDQTIQFTVVLEYLERDKLYLQRNSWVEIENDDTVLSGRTLPLCRVVRLDLIEGQDDDLGQVRGHVTLEADKQIVADLGSLWPQPGDVAAARRKHPLLRRWDQSDGPGAAKVDPDQWRSGALKVLPDQWQALENGIEVCFTGGSYAAGDHWIIPSRTQMQGAGWPARLPDGVAHHYAPLARLDRRDGAWQIAQSEPPLFETAPDLSAQVKRQQQEIDAVRAALVHVEAMLAALQAEVDELRKAAAIARHRLSLDLHGAADLEIGDVVALEPTMEDYVVRANRMDEALVVGVVTGDAPGSQSDHKHYRIAIYGRAQCRVVGNVRPGDLLTTAETAGCAERAALYIQPGSIIGKAIKGHNPQRVNEIGLIDVLITLG